MTDTDHRYGRTGALAPARITLAVAAAYPRPDGDGPDGAEAHAYRRLLAALAAAADDDGCLPPGLGQDAAARLAGLRTGRETRKAWAALLKNGTISEKAGQVKLRGGPDPALPLVLTADDGHVAVTVGDPARLDPDDLDDLDGWVRRSVESLHEHGLPNWLAPSAEARLSATAAAGASALDPDGMSRRVSQAAKAAASLLSEIDKAERALRAAERRRDSLLDTAAVLRAEIDEMREQGTDQTAREKVAQAVALAQAVLDAAALLEASP